MSHYKVVCHFSTESLTGFYKIETITGRIFNPPTTADRLFHIIGKTGYPLALVQARHFSSVPDFTSHCSVEILKKVKDGRHCIITDADRAGRLFAAPFEEVVQSEALSSLRADFDALEAAITQGTIGDFKGFLDQLK